ncbi:MAG: hypothetical protein RBT78_14290, partial [Kiritimatiellia bacterium]|nr:hypothetical protein [Kiritimatiellia bacterium]
MRREQPVARFIFISLYAVFALSFCGIVWFLAGTAAAIVMSAIATVWSVWFASTVVHEARSLQSRNEKMSWFIFSWTLFGLFGFMALLPFLGVYAASSVFGFVGFAGFAGKIYPEEEPSDERDRAILSTAQRIGFQVFWIFFITAAMGTWA